MDTNSTPIVVPSGTDIQLLPPPANAVIAAPPPLKVEAGMFLQPGTVGGIFTHDLDVNWPNKQGVAAASAYLAAGHPIALLFEDQADAQACHTRLTTGAAA